MIRRTVLISLVCLGVLAASAAGAQQLTVTPEAARGDEPFSVRVNGLRPQQAAILRASAKDAQGRVWQSYAGYHASADGSIDVDRDAPAHGSFHTPGTMNLITSMDVPGDGRGRTRFATYGAEPWTVTISLEIDGREVSVADHHRTYMLDVVREVVRDERLTGVLFTPRTPRVAPAILVLGGSEGGLPDEDVAALLASRGYATLALAYFGTEGLPAALQEIPLQYFVRAVEWLTGRPDVDATKLAVVGTSKGAEAALLIAARVPAVRAAIGYAPSSVVWSCLCATTAHSSWSSEGIGLPFIAAGAEPTYRPPQGFPITPAVHYRYRIAHARNREPATIPVEYISAEVLLISGGDDQMWPSDDMARAIVERMSAAGLGRRVTHLSYQDAGHLIGKAFYPSTATLVGGRLETGGTPQGNAAAQRDSWPKVLAFLDRTLR